MTSCMLHVDFQIQPKEIALLKLEYSEDHDISANSSKITEGDFIGSAKDVKLTFKGADADQSILSFEQFK